MTIETTVFGIVLFAVLSALSVIDFKTLRLPDALTFPLIGIGLVYSALQDKIGQALLGALAGYIALFLLETIYHRLRGREGLGRGDAKLLAAGGAWCGLYGLPFIVMIASGAGLVYALLLSVKSGHEDRSQPQMIPFGPFLSLGIFITWLALLSANINQDFIITLP